MNGDLGNLLTGEMGEAEARFAHEDFAGDYGRRIAGRVRRRRTVRAVGVGGGTMLTAGALAVGATHMPWGVLGAAPGMGGSDCVTPSATDDWQTHSTSIDTGGGIVSELVFTDASSGATILRGTQQPDGTYLFTDGQGNPLSASPGVGGYYTVELPPGAYYDDVTRSISLEPGGAGTASSQNANSTPSPSEGDLEYWVSIDTDQGSLANLSILYAATGGVIVDGVQQADGTYRFTDGYGDALAAISDSSGSYTVELPSGVTSLEGTSTMAYRSDAVSTNYLSVYPPTVVRLSGSTPSPTGDCYTPSPTSSGEQFNYSVSATPDPSLAAKPEDVIGDSPFECGFEFPTESYGTDGLWIDDVGWFTPSEVEAAHEKLFGANAAMTFADPNALVPRVTVHRVESPLAEGQSSSGQMDSGDPSLEKVANLALGGLSADRVFAEGRTFVGVIGGKVVATGNLMEGDEAPIESVLTDPGFDGDIPGELMYLVDPSAALTSCDLNPVDLTQVDIVAVAGVIVKHADGTVDGPTYAWLPVGKP